MDEHNPQATEPRWGSEDRDRKAEAIWQTLTHFLGSAIKQGRWIDIGCGNGGIAAHIAPRVSHMLGLDPEPWTQWDAWMREHENLVFLQGGYELESSRIATASVDVVICNQVYEHVPDPLALIKFIHRILKPGGHCYFAGPNVLFPVEPHVYWPFVHWLPRAKATKLMQALGSRKAEDLDAYSVTFWKLTKWLSPYFKITNAVPFFLREVIPAQHSSRLWRALTWLPSRLFDVLTPFSPSFVFVLEKYG